MNDAALAALSAPAAARFCSRCATPLTTRDIGGKPRRVCPDCAHVHFVEPKIGVGALVLDAEQRLLLVKRAVPPEQGKWSLPAGYLDLGESPEQVAAREVREETGLRVAVDELLGVYYNPPAAGGATVFILYRARISGGTLCAADDADDAVFFGPDEMPELAFDSTRDAVEKLRRRAAGERPEEAR